MMNLYAHANPLPSLPPSPRRGGLGRGQGERLDLTEDGRRQFAFENYAVLQGQLKLQLAIMQAATDRRRAAWTHYQACLDELAKLAGQVEKDDEFRSANACADYWRAERAQAQEVYAKAEHTYDQSANDAELALELLDDDQLIDFWLSEDAETEGEHNHEKDTSES